MLADTRHLPLSSSLGSAGAADAGIVAVRRLLILLLSFLFTGALEAFTRKEAEEKVVQNGGVSAAGVSKTLDYLVVGAGKGAKSSKQKKAEQLISAGRR